MKKAGLWAAMVLILAGAILYSLPYVRAYRIVSALKDRDGERLTAYVDFPQIREGLRGGVGGPGASTPGNDLARLARSVSSRIANQLLEQLVTPETLAMAFRRHLLYLADREGRERSAGEIYLAFLRQARGRYGSTEVFVFTLPQGDGGTILLRMGRTGLTWRLNGVSGFLGGGGNHQNDTRGKE